MSFIEIEFRQQKKEFHMADLQAHDFYEIYYLLKGERNIFIEDKIFTLSENSIVIIPPFHMHKTEGGPYKRLNLYISGDLLDESEKKFLSACSAFFAFKLEGPRNSMLTALTRPFLSSVGGEDVLRKKYSVAFAKILLYVLQSSNLTPLASSEAAPKSRTNKSVIMDVVAFINAHFRENITLDLLKKKFFISKNTLCKNFQEVMKCSVIEYCSAVRLNEAKHLLLTTKKSIEDVADSCGYSSANYFSLFFKSKTGISPSGYRKKR